MGFRGVVFTGLGTAFLVVSCGKAVQKTYFSAESEALSGEPEKGFIYNGIDAGLELSTDIGGAVVDFANKPETQAAIRSGTEKSVMALRKTLASIVEGLENASNAEVAEQSPEPAGP